MNKYQKELIKHSLQSEKQVLTDLKRVYEQAEKDIDAKLENLLARFNDTEDENLRQSIIYQRDYQLSLKKQVSGILDQLAGQEFDTVSDYLKRSYEDGFIGTLYDMQKQGVPLIFPIDQAQVVTALLKDTKLSKGLYTKIGENVSELKKRVQNELTRGIAQNYTYDQIARNIRNQTKIGYNKSMRIARTEGHRIQQAAQADVQIKAKNAGADVVKQWDATLDGNTRPQHRELDGQIREIDEPFTVGGYEAQYPGEFGVPWLDINCRCTVLTRARWAVEDDSDSTKWDNENGQLIKIDSKNYQDFKKQYYEKQFTNNVKSDKIEKNDIFGADAYSQERKNKALWDKTGGAEFDKEYRSVTGEIWRNSTDEEKRVLYDYTEDKYRDINNSLRNDSPISDATVMKKLIDKSVAPTDTWLQRGDSHKGGSFIFGVDRIDFDNLTEEQMISKILGKEIIKKDFTSTGSGKGKGFTHCEIITNIYCPKGTKMIYAEPFSKFSRTGGLSWDGIAGSTYFSGEDETIIQAGTKFRITKVEKSGDKWYIDMDVIGQD